MPRKKANAGAAAASVPQGRRTRRQTMQMLAREQTPSPDADEVAESPPSDPIEVIGQDAVAIVSLIEWEMEN